ACADASTFAIEPTSLYIEKTGDAPEMTSPSCTIAKVESSESRGLRVEIEGIERAESSGIWGFALSQVLILLALRLHKLPWQATLRIPRPTQMIKDQAGALNFQNKPRQFQFADSDPLPKKGAGPMQPQAQNSTTSQAVCTHTAPGSLAEFDFWFEGEDPNWAAAERTILTMRDAINREAVETGTAEIEQSAEGSEMDL
ncbi:9640_t:CDS:2, partial [Acaulospora colombiana]